MYKLLIAGLLLFASIAGQADEYTIDTKGTHAFIQFRIKHLGYSWLYGRFNTFEGKFDYSRTKPDAKSVSVTYSNKSSESKPVT